MKDIKEMKAQEKDLVPKLFPIMKKYEKSDLEVDSLDLKEFCIRVDEIKKNREKRY
ncbi:hypothetical protein HOO60_01465 [Fusobacterium nucleatum]|nr:hypothetical protein [Fusobacterium nucleatum]QJX49605.1 hypothetical protein HOO60_01465 [Fusobacterium nucleatum]